MSHPIFGTRLGVLAYRLVTENRFWDSDLVHLSAPLRRLPPGARVLDVGCGPGRTTLHLASLLDPGVEVVGVDLSRPMIDTATQQLAMRPELHGRVRFVHADGKSLPFDTDRFDAVVGHSVLYLVDRPEEVLTEAARVTRPGGVVTFMEPASEGSLLTAMGRAIPHLLDALRAPLSAFLFLHAIVQWRILARLTRTTVSTRDARRWTAHAGLDTVRADPTFGRLGWCLSWRVPDTTALPARPSPVLAAVAGER